MNKFLRKTALRLIVLSLFVGLNYTGLLAVGNTIAYFTDVEDSIDNTFYVATLNFGLESPADFAPEVTPEQNTFRTINLVQEGILDFEYTIAVAEPVGDLCDYLTLKDDLGVETPLVDYVSLGNEFPTTSSWNFESALTNDDIALEGETCAFKFVFEGTQLNDCLGFSDIEEIENIITAGEWGPGLLINKVYYDVDCKHGSEPENEWVELYNPSDEAVNLYDWQICNHESCLTILDNVSIPSLGFAVVSQNSNTWNYWDIPSEVIKISNASGTMEMDNDADMLMLKNYNGSITDQMNWGIPTSTWPNYNSNVWDPGAIDVAEGHLLGRSPTGVDTNTAADWVDFGIPTVWITNTLGNIWYCGGTYPVNWEVDNPNGASGELNVDMYYITDDGAIRGIIDANDTVYLVEEDLAFNLPPDGGQYMLHITGDYCYYGYVWVKLIVTGPENPMLNNRYTSHRIFEPPMPTEGDMGLCWIDVLAAMEAEVGPEFPEEEPSEENDIFNLSSGDDQSADLPEGDIIGTDTPEEDGTTSEEGFNEEPADEEEPVDGPEEEPAEEEPANEPADEEEPTDGPTDEEDLFNLGLGDDQPADLPEGDIIGTDTSEEDGVNNG